MDSHLTRGFSPLSGLEIINAVCGSVRQELQKHDFLSINLAYPVVKWKVTVELELASSVHAQPAKIDLRTSGEHEQTDEHGVPVETGVTWRVTAQTSHEVEFPDLTREQFIDGPKAPEPEPANVAVAPTQAGVESYPGKFPR